MAEDAGETPEQTTGGTPGADDEGETPNGPDDLAGLRAAIAKERGLRQRFEAEAKRNAAAARRLAEVEEADKTEAQKLGERAEQAERRAAEAEARTLRLEIAGEKGLSLRMAARLQGGTREELEADAEELLKELRPGAGAAPRPGETAGGRPREALRSGTAPEAQPEENDPDKLAAMIPRG